MGDKHFEFADFINEFKVDFVAKSKAQGVYNDEGEWMPGSETQTDMHGIILPLNKDDLQYVDNGIYTTKDRKVYTTEPLEKGQEILYKGQSYTIDGSVPYDDYADVYIYFAKGVEA